MDDFSLQMRQYCFFLPQTTLKYLGMSTDVESSRMYKYYSYVMITVAALYPWGNMHLLLHNLNNYDVLINSLFNCIGGYAGFLKIAMLVYHRPKFAVIYDKIKMLQQKHNVEKWSQDEAYNLNKKMLAGLVLYYTCVGYFVVGTMVERLTNDNSNEWKTPIVDISVINITYSPNYEIAWMYQSVGVTVISSAFCVTDLLIASILVDITIQFKLLYVKIKRVFDAKINSIAEIKQSPTKTSKTLHQSLKHIILHHLFLIDLTNEVNEISSPVIFTGVLGSLLITSCSLYYASVLPLLDFRATQSYLEIAMIIMALFFVSYCGTEVAQASESIANACYEVDFVGTDISFQKSLVIMIMRSQKPMQITVGSFGTLSVGVFVQILRTTYSYFMVLRKSNDSIEI